jgi:hypothetical protein
MMVYEFFVPLTSMNTHFYSTKLRATIISFSGSGTKLRQVASKSQRDAVKMLQAKLVTNCDRCER